MAREQDGGALRQHARKEYARSIRLQRTVNADVASLHDQPVAETVDNARRQQGPTKGVRNGGPHRRGISGDMMRTTACQLERPSTPGGRNPAEETLPITVSGKWKGRRQGVGSGHKVPLMGVQQNAPGGKGPDNSDAALVIASADSTGRTKRERLTKANPFLEHFTVADLKAWADRRMRGPNLRLPEVLAADARR